ncbi:MAG: hypothetical protein COA73_14010 [Candidatus Hydrogenedentota bacterium]|nr:MAG: hypothetical protein COA73_14010 [Candidatus Hydrogenedentota bacterium]
MPTLMTAAKSARAPYMTPSGPDVLNPVVALSGNADEIFVTGTADDTLFENSNGAEPVQNITAAECYIDIPPWEAGAVAIPLTASDGSFNASQEGITGTVSVGALSVGQHILFIRAQDSNGNWGNITAVFYTKSASGIPAMSWPALVLLALIVASLGGLAMRWRSERS